MSMDSLMNLKPYNALVVVEGESEENFFKTFCTKLNLNLAIHCVRCNVYTLFKWMTDECGSDDLSGDDLVLDIPKLIAEHANPNEKDCLNQHYDELYLIYDCDLQDSRLSDKNNPYPVEKRARANIRELRQMVKLLNDQYTTTVGKLYLNYPMFESCIDADSFDDPMFKDRVVEISKLERDGYKHRVNGRLLSHALRSIENWSEEDFFDLIKMNVGKAAHIMKQNEPILEDVLSQEKILEQQVQMIDSQSELGVLNTSVFLPIDQFAERYPKFYERVMSQREYPKINVTPDNNGEECDFVILSNTRPHGFKQLIDELKGIIRVIRDVDVIVFSDDFCKELPDYHECIKKYDTSDGRAKNAALKRWEACQDRNVCCRADYLRGGTVTADMIVREAKTLVFVK